MRDLPLSIIVVNGTMDRSSGMREVQLAKLLFLHPVCRGMETSVQNQKVAPLPGSTNLYNEIDSVTTGLCAW